MVGRFPISNTVHQSEAYLNYANFLDLENEYTKKYHLNIYRLVATVFDAFKNHYRFRFISFFYYLRLSNDFLNQPNNSDAQKFRILEF